MGLNALGYSASRIRLLVNRYQKGQDVSIKEVEKTLGFQVFWSIPNDYKSLIRSIQSGDPLTLTNQFDSSGKELLRYVCPSSWHSDRISSQIRWRLLGASERHSQQVDAVDHSQSAEELVRFGTATEIPPGHPRFQYACFRNDFLLARRTHRFSLDADAVRRASLNRIMLHN